VTRTQDGAIPEVVRRWQHEVHVPGVYDLEVDTSAMSPEDAADAIGRRLRAGPPTAFADLATGA
jgi:chloramphenicol 3-O phosphotransferase